MARGPTSQSHPRFNVRSRQGRATTKLEVKKFAAWCKDRIGANYLSAQDPSLNLGATNTIDKKKGKKEFANHVH